MGTNLPFRISRYLKKIAPTGVQQRYREGVLERILHNSLRSWPYEDAVVEVKYDLSLSPPTFGDLSGVLALTRLLRSAGVNTSFSLTNLEAPRQDFQDLAISQEERISELERLSSDFLGYLKSTKSTLNSIDFHSLLQPLEGTGPRVLYQQVSEILWALDRLSLLPQWSVPEFLSSELPRKSECICIEARRGNWDKSRDANLAQLLQDSRYLQRRFSSREIVFLGDWQRHELIRALDSYDSAGSQTAPPYLRRQQESPGIDGAIRELKRCGFYFQRLGGGLGMFAGYTDIDYLILAKSSAWYSIREEKLFPWSTSSQRFVVRPDADTVELRALLN